jgi:5-methyltetrahydrofolate--homocysteine methyltransferase
MEPVLQTIYDAVIDGDADATTEGVEKAIADGLNPGDILNNGMVAAMSEVGKMFEEGEFFVPEMLIAARAMQSGLAVLKPQLVKADIKSAGKVIAGTVKGDLHDIGKNLVCMMLEGAAFEIIDLGTDVSAEQIIEAVKLHKPQVIAMSALLTTTMPNMEEVLKNLDAEGVRDQVKVVVGGAPVTQDYADSIGADGYAADASRATSMVKDLIGA